MNRLSVHIATAGCLLAFTLPGPAQADEFDLQPIPPAAENKPAPKTGPIYVGTEPKKTVEKPLPTVPPFRDGPFGHHHHAGLPDDGGQGYRHFDHPNYRYGLWYRPHAFGYGVAERCPASPFRPRGYGNLFNDPSTCYRIDYNRYVVKNYASDYGPSYYRRRPDERCEDYDLGRHYRNATCDCDRVRKTQVWTLSGHEGVNRDRE
ncbi:MAG: hypothetical protein ACE5KM_05820 [Planctomycetaceae bacterium]